MKEITAFVLTNGEVVVEKAIAIYRQKQITFENDIEALMGEYGIYDDTFLSFIKENTTHLRNIIEEFEGKEESGE